MALIMLSADTLSDEAFPTGAFLTFLPEKADSTIIYKKTCLEKLFGVFL